ncbi:MAG: hypothetical protein ACI9W2_001526 [Gammaproteobacteria bacterium]
MDSEADIAVSDGWQKGWHCGSGPVSIAPITLGEETMQNAITTIVKARADIGSYKLALLPDTLEAAYDFQDDYGSAVGKVGGYKLAVNAAPQMAYFGVSEPVFVRIFCAQNLCL